MPVGQFYSGFELSIIVCCYYVKSCYVTVWNELVSWARVWYCLNYIYNNFMFQEVDHRILSHCAGKSTVFFVDCWAFVYCTIKNSKLLECLRYETYYAFEENSISTIRTSICSGIQMQHRGLKPMNHSALYNLALNESLDFCANLFSINSLLPFKFTITSW